MPVRRFIALIACFLLLAASCAEGRRNDALFGTTTTTAPQATTTTDPPEEGRPGTPGQLPEDFPRYVLLGGERLVVLETATGNLIDVPQPRLDEGLVVRSILDRDQGVALSVRGPLPQDPGAVYVLGDAEHMPRKLGPGVRLLAGSKPSEVWIEGVPAPETGVVEARRVDLEQDAPPIVRQATGLRSFTGVAASSLVVGPSTDAGPVELLDPASGNVKRPVVTAGFGIAADGQRALALTDTACLPACSVTLVSLTGPDKPFTLPHGIIPDRGGLVTPRYAVLTARDEGGPRHVVVLDLSNGDAVVTTAQLPPEPGATPMAVDPTGEWAFIRTGPASLTAVKLESAQVVPLPYELPRFEALAVTLAGLCPCAAGGGGDPRGV